MEIVIPQSASNAALLDMNANKGKAVQPLFGVALQVAQILGFYPDLVKCRCTTATNGNFDKLTRLLLILWSLLCTATNIFVLCYLSIPILFIYINQLGLWNSETILGVITSMKPVLSGLNLIIFQVTAAKLH